MKIANLAGRLEKSERGVSITVRPDTNGPKVRTLRIAIARELGEEIPERGNVVRLKNKSNPDKPGLLMIFPDKPNNDERLFVIDNWVHWKHRSSIGIDSSHTTAQILDRESGYGAWGAGECFFAVLKAGDRVVSNLHGGYRLVLWHDGKEIRKEKMSAEQWLQFSDPDLETVEVQEI